MSSSVRQGKPLLRIIYEFKLGITELYPYGSNEGLRQTVQYNTSQLFVIHVIQFT